MEECSTWVRAARRGARRTGGGVHDREDLVQETLLRVWARIRGSQRAGSVGALVSRTLAALSVDRRRRGRGATSAEAAAAVSAGPSPLQTAETSERRRAVRAAIDALPDAQRETVRLRFFEGLKFREIAARQDVPLNTVLGRMHLATKRLRRALGDDHE